MRTPWLSSHEVTIQRMARAGAKPAEIAIVLGRTTQAIKDRAETLGVSFKQPRAETQPVGGYCKSQCTHHAPCCLRGDVRHTLHICRYEGCDCHDRERYLEAKRARAVKRGQRAAVVR